MTNLSNSKERFLSLDVMRGIIMILLAGESAAVYHSLSDLHPQGFFNDVITQFYHHPWNGLHFWDLVQPAFMTMAGTAMYLSFYHKEQKGITWSSNFKHIAIRSLKLFILGTALHCVYAGKLVWELWNVLTQLAFTSLIAYLIIKRSFVFQIVAGLLLIILSDVLYRTILISPDFNQPYVESHNFGSFIDMLVMGKINKDGWVAINIIPTAAHTIWGMTIGKLLLSATPALKKVRLLLMLGCLALLAGYGLDWLHIVPIIKRISTASFVLVSIGWVMLMFAFVYWLIDIKKKNKYAWIATVVGMNSIFIYLFFETVGWQWVNRTTAIFVNGFTSLLHVTPSIQAVLSALTVWLAEWYLCYWLVKKNIFIKL
jgi:predicted acyltransferase